MDKELQQLNEDVLAALQQMKRAEKAEVHTPERIRARRGRPAGSIAAVTKTPVKIRLDPDVLEALRASGRGWQTRVNDMLRREMFK